MDTEQAGFTSRLYFNGDIDKYKLWKVRFLAHMTLQNNKAFEKGSDVSKKENDFAFAELTRYIDKRSRSLVVSGAKNNAQEALSILRSHYRRKRSMKTLISLYSKLTSLSLEDGQDLTDYLIRAETIANDLEEVGEMVSDIFLTAVVLNGLPRSYDTICTIITLSDKIVFSDVKSSLRAFEETKKCMEALYSDDSRKKYSTSGVTKNQIKCFTCKKFGHKSFECKEEKEVNQ